MLASLQASILENAWVSCVGAYDLPGLLQGRTQWLQIRTSFAKQNAMLTHRIQKKRELKLLKQKSREKQADIKNLSVMCVCLYGAGKRGVVNHFPLEEMFQVKTTVAAADLAAVAAAAGAAAAAAVATRLYYWQCCCSTTS